MLFLIHQIKKLYWLLRHFGILQMTDESQLNFPTHPVCYFLVNHPSRNLKLLAYKQFSNTGRAEGGSCSLRHHSLDVGKASIWAGRILNCQQREPVWVSSPEWKDGWFRWLPLTLYKLCVADGILESPVLGICRTSRSAGLSAKSSSSYANVGGLCWPRNKQGRAASLFSGCKSSLKLHFLLSSGNS